MSDDQHVQDGASDSTRGGPVAVRPSMGLTNRQLAHRTVRTQDFLGSGRITGNPHLTRRWPFGRVKEGLPTNRPELSVKE
ncbi:hypothetical protein HDF13_002327 [Edaphobacter lichenicola]|uniref:Uncharacterized protein n=1 Tax=Tunturiibacter gelidiferens TaxID=3069689 RepID=A0ACC5NZI4_9BACT|nr:hypothetical protein [Edaphobacter lichenicola]